MTYLLLFGLTAAGCGEKFSNPGTGGAGGESAQSSTVDSSSSSKASSSASSSSSGETTSSSAVSSGTGGRECVPSEEVCNGVDDNCDEVVDEDCPIEVTVGEHSIIGHDLFGDFNNGNPFSDVCPADMAIFRISGSLTDATNPPAIEQIRAHCAELQLQTVPGSMPFDYVITRGPTSPLPPYGTMTNMSFNLVCPMNEFVVGISGLATPGIDLQNLRIRCAELQVFHSEGTDYSLGASVAQYVGPQPVTPDNFDDLLPPPQVVATFRGTHGPWPFSIGIGEAAPYLILQR